MNEGSRIIHRAFAVAAVSGAFLIARDPSGSVAEREALASRYRLTAVSLGDAGIRAPRYERNVHRSLQHISVWISAVGAGAALMDLDADGIANDICHVDPRYDAVIVREVPSTAAPARYAAFELRPSAALFDPATMAPMGCQPADLNEDGMLDLVVYYWGRTPVVFLRTDTAASLTNASFVPQAIVLGNDRWFTNAMVVTDVDGDGHADLVVGNYFADGAEILDTASTKPQSMQHSMSRATNAGRSRVLLWRSSGAQPPRVQFAEAPDVFPGSVGSGWTLAIGAQDLNGDLLPELYFANDFGTDHLFLNRSKPGWPKFQLVAGRRTIGTPSSKVLGRDSFKGMGVDFGDVNGDGFSDILVSNITSQFALQESNFAFVATGDSFVGSPGTELEFAL